MRRSPRVLLVGQPGSGKTSFVRYLTQNYLRNISDEKRNSDTPVVFYFQLREFALSPNKFQSWLESEEEEVGKKYALEKNRSGKSLFIFDGLDEMNEVSRQKFTVWLEEFINTRPSHSMIVTSRKLNSLNSGIWQTFRSAMILPFDIHQVEEYCKLVVEDKIRASRFLGVINSNPDLQKFLTNPFSLSLALGMFLLRKTLPFNIGVLCKELVAQLVERWDARRGISRGSEVSLESINSTLGRLAYRLQSNKDFQFAPTILEDLLPVEIEETGASTVLQNLSERTGLVLEVSSGIWSFSHRYLQDFFCANYLVEKAVGLDRELDKHGRELGWVEVWRQVGQLCQDPEFFALLKSRNASDAIMSIDRMVSSLLSHEGLSKTELNKIIEGLTEEMNRENSGLPNVKITDFGAELDCVELDNDSIQILAKTVTHLDYLKEGTAGTLLLEYLKINSNNEFSDLTKRILQGHDQSVPKVGSSSLLVYSNFKK